MASSQELEIYRHFIDGAWADPVDGEWIESVNPYTGTAWSKVPRGTAADVDRAVRAAQRAMSEGPWATMTATDRGKVLRRFGDLIEQNAERLARIEVRDNGKLFTEMHGQLRYIPNWWWYFGGMADKVEGGVVPIDKPDMFGFTQYEPAGVVGAITAWNSPLLFVSLKCAPALAAGCSVVLKPSEFTSASSLEIAALAKEAGFPDGVFNVVTGLGPEAGAALVEHPGVAKISFTGSDAAGAQIYARAGQDLKRVSLELGGKSPNIVFEDCNLDAAVAGAISGIFAANGQSCIAGSRLVVQNSIREEFTQRLVERVGSARIGDPMLPETEVGPIANKPQYEKVLRYIEIAKADGAHCALGGKAATGHGLQGDHFIEPTIFTDVTNDMRIAQEEVFGPILSIIGFDDEADAVRIANDVSFGLAAGVWTSDIARSLRMTRAIKAGMVWVNTYRAVSFMMPFGGMKRSGIGRECGKDAIYEFLETKAVWISMAGEAPANAFVMR
ncbi:aldehyde dehydrogenase [Marinibacterium sp. SX1]|uniref:aldehyde dehydrogenase n=1 Tax=Marinibacterium sp. SX1 TaxID=3388424 RepID=UPI003D17976D